MVVEALGNCTRRYIEEAVFKIQYQFCKEVNNFEEFLQKIGG